MMLRRLTRAEPPTTRFALALAITLTLSCGVELVGVDRAVVAMVDARAAEPDANGGELMSLPDAASVQTGDALPPRVPDAGGLCGDPGFLEQWTDPQRPAPLPGQFVDPSLPCPAIEPVGGTRCDREGQQCDYPVCWGRGKRSWVCDQQRFTRWFDESFLCAASRPCPDLVPRQGDVCCFQIECLYPTYCCKGPTGFQAAVCDGHWSVQEPGCYLCERAP